VRLLRARLQLREQLTQAFGDPQKRLVRESIIMSDRGAKFIKRLKRLVHGCNLACNLFPGLRLHPGETSSMECHELLKMLNEYVDGTVDPAICTEFEKHLAGCNPCQVVIDNIRQTITLYKQGQGTSCRRSFASVCMPPSAPAGKKPTSKASQRDGYWDISHQHQVVGDEVFFDDPAMHEVFLDDPLQHFGVQEWYQTASG